MYKRKTWFLFLLILMVSTITMFFIYRQTQPYITYSKCSLCDGGQYMKMYDYFTGKTNEYKVSFPYYSRVMVPLFASWVLGDVINGFQIVNLIFSILGVGALFLLWSKMEIPLYLMGLAFLWLLFHWTGLIRLNTFDPITVDLPTYLIQTLFIGIVCSRSYYWLLLLGPLAVLQRESITILLLMLLPYEFLYAKLSNRPMDKKALLIVVSAIIITVVIKYVFTLLYPPDVAGVSSVRLVLFYVKEVLLDPFKLIRWVVGIFTAFGGLFMLAIIKIKRRELNPTLLFYSLFSGLYLLLGLIAGGDFTRIVFLGFPFIMTWILLNLRSTSPFLVIVALGLSIFQMRLLNTIPDPGIDFKEFANWYPEFANPNIVLGWLVYFVGCFITIYILNRVIETRQQRKIS